ncbi:MAG: DUF2059 domain-containing protein [Burkholderiaceae bacterium]
MQFLRVILPIRFLLAGGALAVAIASPLRAEPASAESIEALMTLTKAEAIIDSAHQQADQVMRQMLQQQLGNRPMNARERQAFDNYRSNFMNVMREEMAWSRVKPMYIELYRSTFSQADIDGLLEFYRSPTGRVFVDKMPALMQRMSMMMSAQFQSMLPRMKEALEQMVEELKTPKPAPDALRGS